MKKSRRVTWALAGLTLLALTLGLGSASGGATAKGPKNLDQALLQKLKETARGSVAVSTKKGTKFVAFLGAGRNGDLYPKGGASKEAKAREFVREFGPLLGASGADADLVQTDSTTDALGSTHVTYEQRHNGLPVFGGVVKAHLDDAGNLTSVNGTVVPDIEVDTSPRLDASAAAARAIAAVAADPPENASGVAAPVSVLSLQAASTSLEVYRTGLTRGVEGSNQLVYVVDVTNGSSIRDLVFVNAHVGKLVNRYSLVHDALFRRLFEQNIGNQIWQEGAVDGARSTSTSSTSSTSPATRTASSSTRGLATRTTGPAPRCGASTTTRRSPARTRTGTASRRTTATASRRTTSSRTSGATRTRSTRTGSSTSGSRARSTSRTRTSGARSST